ncbi:transmembrane protein, putative (macronuclear) [Tetrahymena thermophila SB210]|uniref:Transmembrane protein, putative n=1 Tax=Tetrahymena thermophila (strain SB210) TaxID=312017 RepID=W7XKS2_TETTS|nr:transmembrane protein, putative [Tetrahymena thermophila SB210]EWS76771.1 transmembrane protein, putative [Tetrahymena thermophila SB210]|eukprot:XP_012650702.1 transmembrane protein, putative [Tetrahymena thermophila SB210]
MQERQYLDQNKKSISQCDKQIPIQVIVPTIIEPPANAAIHAQTACGITVAKQAETAVADKPQYDAKLAIQLTQDPGPEFTLPASNKSIKRTNGTQTYDLVITFKQILSYLFIYFEIALIDQDIRKQL